jgi:hypothetical protein
LFAALKFLLLSFSFGSLHWYDVVAQFYV